MRVVSLQSGDVKKILQFREVFFIVLKRLTVVSFLATKSNPRTELQQTCIAATKFTNTVEKGKTDKFKHICSCLLNIGVLKCIDIFGLFCAEKVFYAFSASVALARP